MKRISFCALCFGIILLTACHKETSNSSPRTDSTNPLGPDTTGTLIVKQTNIDDGGPPYITTYEYDDSSRLISEHGDVAGPADTKYIRDSLGRIKQIVRSETGDSSWQFVQYNPINSGQILYTAGWGITHTQIKILLDSAVYEYNAQSKPATITYFDVSGTKPVLRVVRRWTYDVNGNVLSLEYFQPDSLNTLQLSIGFEFSYDDKINPYFSKDDALLSEKWYLSGSVNNLVKQMNHYSAGFLPDDYIELSYLYNKDGRPVSSIRSGPAIGTSLVKSTYEYK